VFVRVCSLSAEWPLNLNPVHPANPEILSKVYLLNRRLRKTFFRGLSELKVDGKTFFRELSKLRTGEKTFFRELSELKTGGKNVFS
jgi:hypothetical protein